MVNPQLPIRTVAELIAYGKQHPDALKYGSGGYGTTLHLSGELFKSLAGVDMLHIPYKGTAPALAGVMFDRSGHYQDALLLFAITFSLAAILLGSLGRDPGLDAAPDRG